MICSIVADVLLYRHFTKQMIHRSIKQCQVFDIIISILLLCFHFHFHFTFTSRFNDDSTCQWNSYQMCETNLQGELCSCSRGV